MCSRVCVQAHFASLVRRQSPDTIQNISGAVHYDTTASPPTRASGKDGGMKMFKGFNTIDTVEENQMTPDADVQ